MIISTQKKASTLIPQLRHLYLSNQKDAVVGASFLLGGFFAYKAANLRLMSLRENGRRVGLPEGVQ